MNIKNLYIKNITYFSRYYKLIALASLIAVAVITGSLMVGNSVRQTLVNRVHERLGNAETIVSSRNSFIDNAILKTPLLHETAKGYLLSNGFISVSGKLIPVMVWGVNDENIPIGNALVNPALHQEFLQYTDSEIVLRLPATGLTPSGSLFVTENYTTSLRLRLSGVKPIEEGGNLSLKNEQTLPLNIFVNYGELASALELAGKINLILSEKHISETDFKEVWSAALSGMHVRQGNDFTEITFDRIFIPADATQSICSHNPNPNRLFSYLVNSIGLKNNNIHYSFVTSIEHFQGKMLRNNEIILSDYVAKRIHARVGDTVLLTFFTSEDLKVLSVDTAKVFVGQIVPLNDFISDSTLSADFPGLSDVESCTDWESDLPIDMSLITKEEEDFWDLYRNTPKALVSYAAVAAKWSNPYGNATAIRVDSTNANLSMLSPEMFDIQIVYPKEAGLNAAENGVDFSSLFLALGFFIILSALLLLLTPLSEMLYRRKDEIALLQSLGYSKKRIINLLWRESAPVVIVSSLAGVVVGFLYTFLIMWMLGNVWKGATHTDGFSVFPDIGLIFIGFIIGVGMAIILLRVAIGRALKDKRHHVSDKRISLNIQLSFAIIFTLLTVFLIVFNSTLIKSTTLFVFVGVILLGTAALWGNYLILRNGSAEKTPFNDFKLLWANLFFHKKQTILSFLSLAMGVFIVFSVGLNRKGFSDATQIKTGTGGYALWCESAVPIYYNINTEKGREKLAISDLPPKAEALQLLKYSADDASCLNLNKVTNPTVLGVDINTLKNSAFEIERSIFHGEKIAVYEQFQHKTDNVYPVLVDETVLTWGLMRSLGDTLYYISENGNRIALQLAGTLKNSIFQGNILMDKNLFSEAWSDIAGSEVLLLKLNEQEIPDAKRLLEQALSNYGVRVSTTADRLKEFYSVTDTYLSIFLTLGGLGLLLGIVSFIVVVRKNLVSRSQEMTLYKTLGFPDKKTQKIWYLENLITPLYAIITGIFAAVAGVILGLTHTSFGIWMLTLLFVLAFVLCVMIFVKKSVKKIS